MSALDKASRLATEKHLADTKKHQAVRSLNKPWPGTALPYNPRFYKATPQSSVPVRQ
jgi:hypothetical protein